MMRRTAVLAILAGSMAGCDDLPIQHPEPPALNVVGARGPTVMTRNVYLGGDIDRIVTASSAAQVPFIAAEVWAQIQATDFPTRAQALADEIAQANPHLVGLQEVALYHRQSPGDALWPVPTPATEVVYDFLQLLLDALAARGLSYHPAAVAYNSDVELPVFTGVPPYFLDDVRFTDRDVILVRSDIAWANPQSGAYAPRVTIPLGGAGGHVVEQLRGWTSVDATVGAHAFRFVNTHLEVQAFPSVQAEQADALVAMLAGSPLPIVLVGDFNSAADGSQTPTYASLVAAGYHDVWNRVGAPGYTCCQAKDLLNRHSVLDQRLDIIFMRGFSDAVLRAGAEPRIVGDRSGDRTRTGLWPSDHAGVVATLRLSPATGH